VHSVTNRNGWNKSRAATRSDHQLQIGAFDALQVTLFIRERKLVKRFGAG
jgi:hypothetical protein